MESALEAIFQRRSIRKYKKQQISSNELELLISAGLCAPSAVNRQSAIIIAIQSQEEIAYLAKLNSRYRKNPEEPFTFYSAPTVLVVLADASNPNAVRDGSLVIGNVMTAASAMGLGSCWINRAYEVFESEEGKLLLKKWGIGGNYIGVGNCIIGYPNETPAPKPIRKNRVYYIR